MSRPAEEADELPDEGCEDGSLPTYTSTDDTTWEVDCGADLGVQTGVPSSFVVLFVLALVLAVAGAWWKVATARRMARDAGMSEGDATAMALLTDGGLEATYLASNLKPRDAASRETRLRELAHLRDQGLITDDEYATRRQAILDDI